VTVYDTLSQETFRIHSEMVVLALGLEAPHDVDELAKGLGINRGQDGFLSEMHMKFRPVETTVPGVFVGCTYAKNIADSVNQARGAANEASIPLNLGTVKVELLTAEVDQELCVGCDLCNYSEICPYDAISMIEIEPGVKKDLMGDLEKNGVSLSDLAYADLRNSKMVIEYLDSFEEEIRAGEGGDTQLKLEIEQKVLVLKDSLLIRAQDKVGIEYRKSWESKFEQALEGKLESTAEETKTPISDIPRQLTSESDYLMRFQ